MNNRNTKKTRILFLACFKNYPLYLFLPAKNSKILYKVTEKIVMFKNPISASIKKIIEQIKKIRVSKFSDIFPAIINYIICIILLMLFSILWICGIASIIQQVVKSIIDTNLLEIKNEKDKDNFAIMPYYTAIGLCFVIWLPFFLLTLPLVLLGKLSGFLFSITK